MIYFKIVLANQSTFNGLAFNICKWTMQIGIRLFIIRLHCNLCLTISIIQEIHRFDFCIYLFKSNIDWCVFLHKLILHQNISVARTIQLSLYNMSLFNVINIIKNNGISCAWWFQCIFSLLFSDWRTVITWITHGRIMWLCNIMLFCSFCWVAKQVSLEDAFQPKYFEQVKTILKYCIGKNVSDCISEKWINKATIYSLGTWHKIRSALSFFYIIASRQTTPTKASIR